MVNFTMNRLFYITILTSVLAIGCHSEPVNFGPVSATLTIGYTTNDTVATQINVDTLPDSVSAWQTSTNWQTVTNLARTPAQATYQLTLTNLPPNVLITAYGVTAGGLHGPGAIPFDWKPPINTPTVSAGP